MEPMEYCLKFSLPATHSLMINGSSNGVHEHVWVVSVYINANTGMIYFGDIEKLLKNAFTKYENRYLNTIYPFYNVSPTLENLGEVLYGDIKKILDENKIDLNRIEISENPLRTYVVDSNTNSKAKSINLVPHSNGAFLSEILDYTADVIIGNFDKKDESEVVLNEVMPKVGNIKEEISSGLEFEVQPIVTFENNGSRQKKGLKLVVALAFLSICTAVLLVYINRRGQYPWGSDTFGHIFKADLLYKNILNGNIYPLFTELWYNGIQPFRYWAPLPYYILAVFQILAQGDPIAAYNIFIAFCFIGGACGWLLWGIKENRIFLATVVGVLWFCLPDNIRVFFSEGNIPRITIALLLPYLLYFIWQFVEYRRKSSIIPVMILMVLCCLTHLMIAAMIGISVFFFMVYYGVINKRFKLPIQLITAMVLAIGLCGAWIYPALKGGLMSINGEAVSEVMKALTFPFTQSLDPFIRLHNIEIYYFGLSVLVIALLGLFLSNKRSSAGFLTLITIFLGTTTAFVPILIKLPLNQLLWMMRFTPVAYAVFVAALIMWKNAKRFITILMVTLLIFDSSVSFMQLAFNSNPSADNQQMFSKAASVTNQRLAILDGSEFGSFPSYYLCSGEEPKQYAFGWAWQGATTAKNIVLLNTALDKGFYPYMFDRCIEAGCDTVLIKKDKVKDFKQLSINAERNRYRLFQEFSNGYLFKRETPKSFGVISKYFGIAVGASAEDITLEFPGFQIGNSQYIDDYSAQDLSKYEIVYLSGFKYKLRDSAERVLSEIAKRGTKVVIDMNRVPYDPITNRMTFFGVTAQPIQFVRKLPDLHYSNVVYFPTTFKEEDKEWNTVYLENVPNPQGFSWFGGNRIVFIGQHTDKNITFVGFNLLYHGIANEDSQMKDFYGALMGKMANTLPERKVVPLDITFDENNIMIESDENDVNTTLANLDAFVTDSKTYTIHNYLFVGKGDTKIDVIYPYLKEGVIISILAFFSILAFLYFIIWGKRIRPNLVVKATLTIIILLLLSPHGNAQAASINLDGVFTDWEDVPEYTGRMPSSIDSLKFVVSDDNTELYVMYDINSSNKKGSISTEFTINNQKYRATTKFQALTNNLQNNVVSVNTVSGNFEETVNSGFATKSKELRIEYRIPFNSMVDGSTWGYEMNIKFYTNFGNVPSSGTIVISTASTLPFLGVAICAAVCIAIPTIKRRRRLRTE